MLAAFALLLPACTPFGHEEAAREAVPAAADPWMDEVTARIRDAAHGFRADGEAFSVESPAHAITGRFEAGGVELTRAETIVVRSTGWGRPGALDAISPTKPRLGACLPEREDPEGNCIARLEYADAGLTEWWAAGADGVQQGWTVEAPPAGAGALVIDVGIEGAGVTLGDGELQVHGDYGEAWLVQGLAAWDAEGTPLEAHFALVDGGFRVVVADAGAVYPVEIDPVYTTATTTLTGEATSNYFGVSVSGAGDVDNDGYDDVIVGAHYYSSITGRAYVYAGSSAGVSSTATTTLTGAAINNYFGYSVSGAGDVNNDGYDDVIVGAYGYSSNTGRAYVYAGSSAGVSTTPSTTLTGGGTNNFFGVSVAGAGDVDNDGYDDVIVGAYLYSSLTGRAYVYAGSSAGVSSTATTTLTGEATNNYFGFSVSGAGDVDNDGYDDVIVGAYGYSTQTGRAYVYAGSSAGVSSTATTTLTGGATSDYFGNSVSGAGDVNNDGYDDVIVGAYAYSSSTGRAYVHAGNADGDGDGVPSTVDCDDADAAVGAASTLFVDADGDGYGSTTTATVCPGGAGYSAVSTDCDDAAAAVNPGATEVCDASDVDEDCDDLADDLDSSATGGSTYYQDADGDGYGGDIPGAYCDLPSGYVLDSTDCDDTSSAISPAESEICDASDADEDCDGLADDLDSSATGESTFYVDSDGDGYGSDTTGAYCDLPSGYVVDSTDCDDTSSAISPAGNEICDPSNTDEDCDGLADDLDSSATGESTYYQDADGDGYGGDIPGAYCDLPSGYVADSADCDDASAAISPAGNEICDPSNTDEDCDGLADDLDSSVTGESTYYLDADGDGYGGDITGAYCDLPSGYVADSADCDDGSATISPAANEICDPSNTDEDCDGLADDLDSSATGESTFYQDADGDGYGGDITSADCDAPAGYVGTSTDCDDDDSTINAAAAEIVGDEIDQDCDGDEDCYVDDDDDGYTGTSGAVVASADLYCDGPGEALAGAPTGDCDDTNADYYPGANEDDCTDPADYNCDGSSGYADADGDSFAACQDCDDAASEVNPDAAEVCNDLDDDCDGTIDVDAIDAQTWYADADADGYTDPDVSLTACDQPAGYADDTEDDCDDDDPQIFPGAVEIPDDGIDQDCTGADAAVADTGDTDCADDDTGDDEEPVGCGGCASTDGLPVAASLWLAGLALIARRRRVADSDRPNLG